MAPNLVLILAGDRARSLRRCPTCRDADLTHEDVLTEDLSISAVSLISKLHLYTIYWWH